MIAFFPCLSPDGQLIAAERQDGNGVKVAWKDNRTVVSAVGDGPGILINGALVYPQMEEPNAISAGGGLFCADYWPGGLRLSDGRWVDDGYASAMADDGYFVYLTGHDDDTQQVRDLEGYVYDDDAPLEYPSCSRLGIVYSKYTGRTQHAKETWGALRHEQGQRFHASGEMIEHGPIAIDTPDGLYVGAFRDDGVILYKAGETDGWFFPSPNARNLDGKWDGRGVRLVWNRPDGTLEERLQLLTDARKSLHIAAPAPIPIPPVPTPEPETPPMAYERRSPDYTAHVATVAAMFPAEWDRANKEKHGERTDEFVHLLASYLNAKDPSVGLNGKRGSDDLSTDALAYKNPTAPGGAEVIDFIIGAGHQPAWQDVTLPDVLGKFIQPRPWGTTPIPPPTTPPSQPPTPPATGCTCAAELEKLREALDEMTEAYLMLPANLAGLVEQIMEEKLSELPAPEPPTSFPAYEGRIFGQKVRLEPK